MKLGQVDEIAYNVTNIERGEGQTAKPCGGEGSKEKGER